MSVFPAPAYASPPGGGGGDGSFTFTDNDADHAYFQDDTISFTYNTGSISLDANTPVVAELYKINEDTTATVIDLLTAWNSPVKRVACDTSTANTISVSGKILNCVTKTPSPLGVKFYVGGSVDGTSQGALITSAAIPVSAGAIAMIGLEDIFDQFPTRDEMHYGFFVNDEFNADQSYDLTHADVTFSQVINYDDDIQNWITGSMTFQDLNMLDTTAMDELQYMDKSIEASQIDVAHLDPGSIDQYNLGLDHETQTILASMGAVVSLQNPNFNASASSDFTVAGVGSQTGTASAISFNDATDTLTFDVSHFSDYKVSRKTDLQAHINQAKTIIGSSFTAVEGIDDNLSNSLEDLPGMSATGVEVNVISKDPADLPITPGTGTITYNSDTHTGSVTLELSYCGLTESAILAVNIPVEDTTVPVPGNGGTITASNVGSSSLVLNWTAASDDISPAKAIKYYVVLSSSDNISTTEDMEGNGVLLNSGGTANITSYKVTGLTPSSIVYFNIAARDPGGYCAYNKISVTTKASGGGNGGGSGGGNTTLPTPPAQPKPVVSGNISIYTATLTGTPDAATGKTVASVTSEILKPMIDNAKAAETAGQTPVVQIKVDTASSAKGVAVDIPKASFNQLANETKAQVSVTSSLGTVTFDENAVQAISEKAGGDIQISMAKLDTAGLSSDIQDLVGDAPVYDFTVQSGNSKISDFEGGNASISVPYALKDGDDPNAVVVYYINDSGALETVRGAYDPDTHTVKFATDHFSKYAIGYNKVAFADVADSAWYKDAVGFIAARGITTGTDKNNFSPSAKLTRAQFLVMVMKAYGIEPAANTSDNFVDAGSAYYTAYLAKAKELGLANGSGNNLFGPNKNITRQDMFTLLYRTLDLIGEVPAATGSAALSNFTDANSINAYAKTPMEALVAAGVVTGSNDMLTPKSTTTRAEMAQVLFNLLSK
jgi:hypothetical protein